MKELTFKFAIETYTKGKRHRYTKKTFNLCMQLEWVLGQIWVHYTAMNLDS